MMWPKNWTKPVYRRRHRNLTGYRLIPKGTAWLWWHMIRSHQVEPRFSHFVGAYWSCSCGQQTQGGRRLTGSEVLAELDLMSSAAPTPESRRT